MRSRKNLSRFVVGILLFTGIVCLGRSPLRYSLAQSNDENAIRILAGRFFEFYQQKDLTGLISVWSEKSPFLSQNKLTLQQEFTANEKIAMKGFEIRKLQIEGEEATLRVAAVLAVIKAKVENSVEKLEKKNQTIRMKNEGGIWKVWKFTSGEEELAEALVKANSKAEQARLLAEEKELMTVELGQALLTQGRRLFDQGSYTRAAEIYELAMDLAEQLGDKKVLATALWGRGGINLSQGNYTQALDQLQKSLNISEEIGYKAGIAYALNNIGEVHRMQGNYAEALEQYQKSLKISEEMGDKAGIARTLNNMGIVHQSQGDYAQALEQLQKSLKISEEMGDKAGIGRALHNIGNVHLLQGNYAQALEQLQKSLSLFEEMGDKASIASTLNNIGIIHRSQGNHAQALERYQKSLKISKEIGDKAGIAITLSSVGIVHQLQGNYTQALEQYQKSLKIFEEIGDKAGITLALINVGLVYYSQGNYAQALEQYQKSLKISEEIGDKAGIAFTLNNIGEIHRAQGNYSQALQFSERAADLAAQIGLTDDLWGARTTAGKAYFALNQPSQACLSFNQAIATIETLRANVAGGAQEQQHFFESRIAPYHAMVELLIAQSNPDEALIYAERAKARALLDVLASGRVDVTKTMTGPEIEQERKLNSQLVSLNAQIYREKQRQQADQDQLKQFDSQLQKARLDFEAFQTSIYAAHPELKIQRGEAPPLRPEQANALVPNASTALLEFVVAEERTYLFVLTKSTTAGIKVYPLEIKQKDLTDRVERFRGRMANKDFDFQSLSQELYRLLLKPAEKQLQNRTSLVISPDGPLWDLPFQVLQSEGGRYLIEEAAISYTPSLSVLREMQLVRKKKRAPAQTPLLALGNPMLTNQSIESGKFLLRDGKFDPLPEAAREVEALERFYGKTRSKVYTGAAAREEVVKQESARYRILHFATHGVLNDRSPMYSNVMLSQAPGKSDEDGLLEAREILNLDLNADLVVLSACETARGRVSAGEGVIGLTWALFVAGCPRTVVSQWKVQSASTSELMVEFHKGFKTRFAGARLAISTAEALRQAALKLKQNMKYSHPFFWGGFVVVGDGS